MLLYLCIASKTIPYFNAADSVKAGRIPGVPLWDLLQLHLLLETLIADSR